MKPTKQKHGKENTIGKIIYGFLLFMPLLAIGVTCAYAIFNKNAYKSYSNFNTTSENYTNVNDYNMVVGKTYRFISNNENASQMSTTTTNGKMNIENFNLISSNGFTIDPNNYPLINQFVLYIYNSNVILQLSNSGVGDIAFNTKSITFEFTFLSFTSVDETQPFSKYFDNLIYENEIVNYTNTIDNVFYYSVDKVEQSPLFNWANNTATHNVLQDTCNTLGITSTFIPMLLAYWLMISLMYLLYDIALLVVHMAHNRIHDIESSI